MTQAVDFINLGFLSEEEQELILEVLRRDEELRQAEEQRVRKLKVALLDMKRRGAKRGSGKYSQKVCGRCLEPLSRISFFSSKCHMCNHHVCRKCRTLLIGGSWLCSVCARESDVKKMTGDWFYDQRVNRFTIMPGHDLVRVSLRKKPPTKKRETAGELLLRSNEPNLDPPPPAQKKQTSSITRQPNGNPELITSQESFESKPTHSDTESAENVSIISSKNDTESRHGTPEQSRKERRSLQTSPTPSSVSSKTTPLQAETTSRKSASSDTNNLQDVIPVSQNLDPDVERLFKKSIKRDPRTAGCVSTLDLRDGPELTQTAMGNRSKSVPGLEIQQEDREEDEDIDSLVNFHKNKMASSSSSLLSSKSTLGSMASVYSGAGDCDSVEVSGEVIFSLRYDQHTQGLQVFIEECHGLACGDASRQTSNPYVKCYLLPEKSRQSKRKTSTKRNTINPVFKETLKYSINRSQLFTRSLLISVWHHGRLSRNAFLGEVEIPLDCRDLDSPYVERAALLAKSASYQPPSPFARYRGDLVISLKYITPNKTTAERNKGKKGASDVGGELHVLVKEANNLMPTTVGGTTVSFVKGYLFPTRGKSTKRKTPVVKKNVNPHYDHIFAYKSVSLEQLKEMCLEITVWHKEMMSNEFLGGVRLSSGHGSVKVGKEEVDMDSVGEEVSLWQKMMQYPDSWAEGVLPLRSTMTMDK